MRIWKLTPTNLDDPIWKKWTPEPIMVRAESEIEARRLAVWKTTKTFPSIPGMPIAWNPWAGNKKLEDPGPKPTLCEDITNQPGEFSVDGSAEVLRQVEQFPAG